MSAGNRCRAVTEANVLHNEGNIQTDTSATFCLSMVPQRTKTQHHHQDKAHSPLVMVQ